MSEPARYVIINEIDAPQPEMVCQWVPGIGYCYLDRRGTKPNYDGMVGAEATPIEAFGFTWSENPNGTVIFRRSEAEPSASYRDGVRRRWQSAADSFELRQIEAGEVKGRAWRP